MAMNGSLGAVDIVNVIELARQSGEHARLVVQREGKEAALFLEQGEIVHATLDGQSGEDVVAQVLTWREGDFDLEVGVAPPERTMAINWSSFLLGSLQNMDEATDDLGDLAGLNLDFLSESEAPEESSHAASQTATQNRKENGKMAIKKRSEVLAEQLEQMLANSTDIKGAVVIAGNGLVLASALATTGTDATRVGAEGAALLGLSKRTLENLKCGGFKSAVLEGNEGYVLAADAGPKAMLLGLSDHNVNLGMALLEVQEAAATIEETMA